MFRGQNLKMGMDTKRFPLWPMPQPKSDVALRRRPERSDAKHRDMSVDLEMTHRTCNLRRNFGRTQTVNSVSFGVDEFWMYLVLVSCGLCLLCFVLLCFGFGFGTKCV